MAGGCHNREDIGLFRSDNSQEQWKTHVLSKDILIILTLGKI